MIGVPSAVLPVGTDSSELSWTHRIDGAEKEQPLPRIPSSASVRFMHCVCSDSTHSAATGGVLPRGEVRRVAGERGLWALIATSPVSGSTVGAGRRFPFWWVELHTPHVAYP